MPWFYVLFQLVEKMIEQSRENVSAKKNGRGMRLCGSSMW
jgi:ABA responsive element binding factor